MNLHVLLTPSSFTEAAPPQKETLEAAILNSKSPPPTTCSHTGTIIDTPSINLLSFFTLQKMYMQSSHKGAKAEG